MEARDTHHGRHAGERQREVECVEHVAHVEQRALGAIAGAVAAAADIVADEVPDRRLLAPQQAVSAPSAVQRRVCMRAPCMRTVLVP
jgi:hypothetical protein